MKIKQFINEKPRLKKALKIIGISITIFFAGFGVVCSGLLVGSCANQKTKEVVATTPIHHQKPTQNALDQNGVNYLYSLYEVFNVDVLFSIYRANQVNLQNVNSVTAMPLTATFLVTFDTFNPYDTPSWNSMTQLSHLRIEYYSDTRFGYNNSYREMKYRYTFRNMSDGLALECYFSIIVPYTPTDDTPTFDGSMFFAVETGSTSVINNIGLMVNAYEDSNLWDLLEVYNTNSSYQYGYSAGYTAGHNGGYQQGYDYGYALGRQEASGISSNPFNLIRNAFNSIAGILNIQVLPNLTLGVLIFTPIIVTIIIVVIKMIRG